MLYALGKGSCSRSFGELKLNERFILIFSASWLYHMIRIFLLQTLLFEPNTLSVFIRLRYDTILLEKPFRF